MTPENLTAILKQASAKAEPGDTQGWEALPEGATLTLYVAHDGASLTVNRVEALRQQGEIVYARTTKKDMFCIVRADVFAIGVDGSASAQAPRRAGFG